MLALVIVLAVVLAAVVVFVVVRERRSAAYRARYRATREDVDAARSHSVATSRGSTRGSGRRAPDAVIPGDDREVLAR
jgi:hypothetical protein